MFNPSLPVDGRNIWVVNNLRNEQALFHSLLAFLVQWFQLGFCSAMTTPDNVQLRSVAANQVPDEIISEILSPLLKHPGDKAFSERSPKVLLDPGYSSSTYLLVCKAWLRVSTPLLYNVVILRTTAQAVALQKVLQDHPEIGGFIKKLRIEGGFGTAMQIILKCAPNITDLFISLFIYGTDSVKGLCSGLSLINPQRVILYDASSFREKANKNKQVTQLFETLLVVVTKWNSLVCYHSILKLKLTYNAENLRFPVHSSFQQQVVRVGPTCECDGECRLSSRRAFGKSAK
ncbi:hypothetical protein B0H16DRAFT_994746 [Mycena metata]|uniref:F-box domain-containing protein n=1 Tax=Mycena metata TaxID=1033252 RepID=A0AAD7IIY4_9AGAR|nr:hypothetical protein B0H16DRAFT_994746 [Mycena metata]